MMGLFFPAVHNFMTFLWFMSKEAILVSHNVFQSQPKWPQKYASEWANQLLANRCNLRTPSFMGVDCNLYECTAWGKFGESPVCAME